jgi:hypothetical protein
MIHEWVAGQLMMACSGDKQKKWRVLWLTNSAPAYEHWPSGFNKLFLNTRLESCLMT